MTRALGGDILSMLTLLKWFLRGVRAQVIESKNDNSWEVEANTAN